MKTNNITLDIYKNITVLRDDLLVGGTKSRFLHLLLDPKKKGYVYASPVYGGFQIALSSVATSMKKQAIIFTPERKKPHYNTLKAADQGAEIIEIRPGHLRVINKRAKDFVASYPEYQYLKFGANYPDAIRLIAGTMQSITNDLGKEPSEVYCAVGSGTLVKGILAGTTKAKVTGVVVGKEFAYEHERLRLIKYPKGFDYLSKYKAPFQSMPNYDLKALEVCLELKKSNDVLFWNVY